MPEGKPTHTGATEQSAMLADLSTTPTRRHTVPTSAWILLFLSTLTNRLKSASPYVNPQPCCGRGADCKLPPIRPQNRLVFSAKAASLLSPLSVRSSRVPECTDLARRVDFRYPGATLAQFEQGPVSY